jgi:hypothetical protein
VPIALRCDCFTLRQHRTDGAPHELLRRCRPLLAWALTLLLGVTGCGPFPLLTGPGPAPVEGSPAAASDGHPHGRGKAAQARQPRRIAGSLDGRTGAHLTVGSAAASIEVRTTDLPGVLYRVSTPADSGLSPRVTGSGGFVRVLLAPTGDDGPDRVEILLNRWVRWHLRLTAGAGEQHLELGTARLSGIELGAGAGLVTMRLPRTRQVVPIWLTGPVGTTEIVVPAGAPVRVRLRRGASAVTLPWTVRAAVRAGTVLIPQAWAGSPGRYLLDARGTMGTLTVRS